MYHAFLDFVDFSFFLISHALYGTFYFVGDHSTHVRQGEENLCFINKIYMIFALEIHKNAV